MCHKAHQVADDIIIDELREIQIRTHEWGVRNQEEFESSKEYFKIAPFEGSGGGLQDARHPLRHCLVDEALLGICDG